MMPLPVQPALPKPGPYGTQADDAKAPVLTNPTWTVVGYPQDVLVWSSATEATGFTIEATNDQVTIVKVGAIAAGGNQARIGKVGYKWMRTGAVPTGVVKVSGINYLVPGTTISSGLRSAVTEDPLNPFRYLLAAESASEVDWGDGTVDSEDSHTYAEEGFFWVSVKGQTDEGEEGEASHLIQVGGSPDHRALQEVVLNAAAEQGLEVSVADTKSGLFGIPELDTSGRTFGAPAEAGSNPGSETGNTEEAEYTREELESLTNAELSDILADQGKATGGTKTELVDRILA
jgi:hypothetical protein